MEKSKPRRQMRPLLAAGCIFAVSLTLVFILAWLIGLPETVWKAAMSEVDKYAWALCDFAPGVLLAPEEAANHSFAPFTAGADKGTFHCMFSAPDDRGYILIIDIPGNAAELYINGGRIDGPLPVGRRENAFKNRYILYDVRPLDGQIDVLLPVVGYDDTGVEYCYAELIEQQFYAHCQNIKIFKDSLVTGGLSIAFLLLLSIWFFHIKMPQNLYFALCCLIMAVRKTVTDQKILTLVFPDGKFLRLEYICICLIVPLMALYLNRVFARPFHKYASAAICVLPLLYVPVIMLTEYPAYHAWLPLFQVFIAVSSVYMTVRILMKLSAPSLDRIISATGLLVFLFSVVADIFSYSDMFEYYLTYSLTEPGMLIMVLTQLAVLFTGNARITGEAEVAKARLARENAALWELNQMKSEFLQDISHEMQNPLTTIRAPRLTFRFGFSCDLLSLALRNRKTFRYRDFFADIPTPSTPLCK